MPPLAYAVYVEKEQVGKRVKSTKIKVQWQITFENEWTVHAVELKHSIVSGKREVWFDGQVCAQSKKLLQSMYEHHGTIGEHDVRVTIEDTFEGYLYDLVIDGLPFHQLPKIKISQLDELRKKKEEPPPTANFKTDFASFTGGSKSLDGAASSIKRRPPSPPSSPEEGNLLGDLDWATAPAAPVHTSFQVSGMGGGNYSNPFESVPASGGRGGNVSTSYGGYASAPPPPSMTYVPAPPPTSASSMYPPVPDPFAAPPSHMTSFAGYGTQPGAPPGVQTRPYDPFS